MPKILFLLFFILLFTACSELQMDKIKCHTDNDCPNDAVCEAESCILKTDFPNRCDTDAQCKEEKTYCDIQNHICRDNSCEINEDCGPYEYCDNLKGICHLKCESNRDCESTEYCNDDNNHCEPDTPECTSNTDCVNPTKPICDNGECVADTPECRTNTDCETNPERSICVDGNCIAGDCSQNSDCDSESFEICDTANHICICQYDKMEDGITCAECNDNNNCSNNTEGKHLCNSSKKICVECITGFDCGSDKICVEDMCMSATDCKNNQCTMEHGMCDYDPDKVFTECKCESGYKWNESSMTCESETICTAGNKRCSSNGLSVEICNSNENSWNNFETCSTGKTCGELDETIACYTPCEIKNCASNSPETPHCYIDTAQIAQCAECNETTDCSNDKFCNSNHQCEFNMSPFITQWSAIGQKVIIPVDTSNYTYDYDIDCDYDGNGFNITHHHVTGAATCEYDDEAVHNIAIKGVFPYSKFSDIQGNDQKLLSVTQWGSIKWKSMKGMFENMSFFNMQEIIAPDLSEVKDMSNMFANCGAFNSNISAWDVSNVTNMSAMFSGATDFNQDLSSWNVCNVTNHEDFDTNTNSWTEPKPDFTCQAEQRPFVTKWNSGSDKQVKILTNNNYTYDYDIDCNYNGTVFTPTSVHITGNFICNSSNAGYLADSNYTIAIRGTFPHLYNTDKTSTSPKLLSVEQWGDIHWLSMKQMFFYCSNMVINATDTPDLSEVEDMYGMFFYATSFNSNINNWNVSNVTNMRSVFSNATNFNKPLNNWDVSNVTNMYGMFDHATNFNQNISTWEVDNVINMHTMFSNAKTFNQDLNNWHVNKVTDMNQMFSGAENFNGNISDWNVSGVRDMKYMFSNAIKFNQNLSNWDVCNAVENVYFDKNTDDWQEENKPDFYCAVKPFVTKWDSGSDKQVKILTNNNYTYDYDIDCNYNGTVFNPTSEHITGDFTCDSGNAGYFADSNYTIAIRGTFPHMVNNTDNSNSAKLLSVEKWGSIHWLSMANMFSQCTNMIINANDTPDLSEVTNMNGMFMNATNFNSGINDWNVSNVTSMVGTFRDAIHFNKALNNWDVSRVTSMDYMFKGATDFNQNIGNWNIDSTTSINHMFENATSFNQNLSNWHLCDSYGHSSYDSGATAWTKDRPTFDGSCQ